MDTQLDTASRVVHHFRFSNAVPLNESNPEVLVNFLQLLLLFALLAKLAGQDSARGIAIWINLRIQLLNQALELPVYHNRQHVVSGPHATTYARVLGQTLNPIALEAVVQRYFRRQAPVQ